MALFDNLDFNSLLAALGGAGDPSAPGVVPGQTPSMPPLPPPAPNTVLAQDFNQPPMPQGRAADLNAGPNIGGPSGAGYGGGMTPPAPPAVPVGLPPGARPFGPAPPPVAMAGQLGLPPGAQPFPPGPPPAAQAPPPGAIPGAGPPGQPYPNVGPFLSNIFGRNPRLAEQIAGSLGAGLTSVGQNWNKPGLAAFAGSAGAAITGGSKADDTYFGKLAQAVKINDAKDNAETRAKLYQERTEAMTKVGTLRSRAGAWQNTDIGKYNLAETRIGVNVEGKRKELQPQLNSPIPSVRDAAQKQLEDFRLSERARVYGAYGLDPSRAQQYQNMGKPVYKPDGKIDMDATSKQAHHPKSWDDWNAVGPDGRPAIPKGSYYVDPKTGKTLIRQDDPPLPADHPQSPLSQLGAEVPDLGESEAAA